MVCDRTQEKLLEKTKLCDPCILRKDESPVTAFFLGRDKVGFHTASLSLSLPSTPSFGKENLDVIKEEKFMNMAMETCVNGWVDWGFFTSLEMGIGR